MLRGWYGVKGAVLQIYSLNTKNKCLPSKRRRGGEIWWNIYGHVYDAIQMQVAESLILNGDHIKSFIPPTRKTWTSWDHVFLNEKLEEYMKNICKMSTEELNYRGNQSRRGFWYYHWLAKVGSFYCQCFVMSSSFIFRNSIKWYSHTFKLLKAHRCN